MTSRLQLGCIYMHVTQHASCMRDNKRYVIDQSHAAWYEASAAHVCSVKQLRSGGWELLSTPFEALKGFEPMTEYIEYSTDFFDGKHYVLRGSSPVTHPSVCRDSFRNFYQCNYPYVFSKFR